MMVPFNRGEGIPWRPALIEAALRTLLRSRRRGVVLLAEGARGGGPLGYAVATFGYDLEFGGPDAFLTELFVRADKRGRGVARRLLRGTVAELRRGGARAVHLVVRPENRSAIALYASERFEPVPRRLMTLRLPDRADRALRKARGR